MMLSLDKTSLLIGFYLCLHFHYCLPQEEPSLPLSSLTEVVSDGDAVNKVISENSVIYNKDQYVYKCSGRLHDVEATTVQIPAPFMSDNRIHVFPLKKKELNCKKGRFKILFQTHNDNHIPPNDIGPSSDSDKPIIKVLKMDSKSWRTTSYEDNSIRIMKYGAYLHVGDDFFHPEEYCFDQIDPKSELTLFVCFPECYGQRPCVTKCCSQDEVWDVENKRCRKAQITPDGLQKVTTINNTSEYGEDGEVDEFDEETIAHRNGKVWSPWLFSRSVDNCVKKVTYLHRQQLSVHIQQRLPSCEPSEYQLIPLRKLRDLAFQRWRILWRGGVIVRDKKGNWSEFTPGRYCVDGMVNYKAKHGLNSGKHGDSERDYSGAFEDQILLVCPDQMPQAIQKKPIPLKYAIMLLIAAIILFVSAIISFLLYDRQSVYEWTVNCEVIAMFFLILCVGVAHTIARKPEKSDFGSVHCVFIGAASHFFWLSTFCWLFIINFEIWWHFRSLVQLTQTRKWFRFGIYQLVGWGFPLFVVSLGLILDRIWGLQNEDLDCTNIIVPNYGQLNCYISKVAQGPYLFYPIGVILGCNLIFYLLTVCKMWGYQKKSQAIIQYRSKGQTQPTLIFAKLFIVMGVSWIFEVVSWAITTSEVDRIPLYWVVFDIVTLFQAISIFVIFIWKKQVLTRLWYKFPSCQSFLTPLTKLPGCGIIPNERERMASLNQLQYSSPNKIPRENGFSVRRHQSLQTVPPAPGTGASRPTGAMIPSSSGYSSSASGGSNEIMGGGGGDNGIGNGLSNGGSNNGHIQLQQPQQLITRSAEQIGLSSV